MATLISDISAADWSIRLNEPGSVVENLADINQCIKVILETPKGSRAHEPLFGCDIWQYIDQPMSEALPRIVAAVIEAVEEWEPRIKLVSIVPVTTGSGAGKVTLQIEWKLVDEDMGVQTTDVTL